MSDIINVARIRRLRRLKPAANGARFDPVTPVLLHPAGRAKRAVAFITGCIVRKK